jgi:hypothetical protein
MTFLTADWKVRTSAGPGERQALSSQRETAMATLTAWRCATPHGADDAPGTLQKLRSEADAELISTNLSADQESRLREAFAHED